MGLQDEATLEQLFQQFDGFVAARPYLSGEEFAQQCDQLSGECRALSEELTQAKHRIRNRAEAAIARISAL